MSEFGRSVRALGKKVSNWGRWGSDDELGTLNHITPEKRVSAARLVRRGVVFSLQVPMSSAGPMTGTRRTNPVHSMTYTGLDPLTYEGGACVTDDVMFLFLQSGTEWDALGHVFYDGLLYNGYPAASVDSQGAHHLGIDRTSASYVSRGLLLDWARWRGVDCLESEERLTGDDLDAICVAQGVSPEPGDILLIRTGVLAHWDRTQEWSQYHKSHPGLDFRAVEWLHDHDIAAVASDNGAVEGLNKDVATSIPLHMVGIRDMGLSLGETFYLEELAEDSLADGIYESFLVAPALSITGAVGSPVNPLALK